MGVKCLAQEHNTMFPARPRTRTTRSRVERTNHEATAPPTIIKSKYLVACDWLKKLLFSTNSLAKLLSDSLLSDSSISQSHSKNGLNQPITTLVSITTETMYRLLNSGFLSFFLSFKVKINNNIYASFVSLSISLKFLR